MQSNDLITCVYILVYIWHKSNFYGFLNRVKPNVG